MERMSCKLAASAVMALCAVGVAQPAVAGGQGQELRVDERHISHDDFDRWKQVVVLAGIRRHEERDGDVARSQFRQEDADGVL